MTSVPALGDVALVANEVDTSTETFDGSTTPIGTGLMTAGSAVTFNVSTTCVTTGVVGDKGGAGFSSAEGFACLPSALCFASVAGFFVP